MVDWAGFPPSPLPAMPVPAPPGPPPPPPPPPPSPSDKCIFTPDRDYKDGFIAKVAAQTQAECCGSCLAFKGKKGKQCAVAVFTGKGGECFLKASTANPVTHKGSSACAPKQQQQ